jgi:hypothetical protein
VKIYEPAARRASFVAFTAAKMPAKKKASAVDNLNARLSLVVKSGKISLGHRTTVKALRKSQGASHLSRRCRRSGLRAPPPDSACGAPCALVPGRVQETAS